MHVQNNLISFEPGESALNFHSALVIFIDYAPEQLDDAVSIAVCNQLCKPDALWAQALKLSEIVESTNPTRN